MFIGIRKEQNGKFYLDKNSYSRTEAVTFTPEFFEQFKEQNPTLEYSFENSQKNIKTEIQVYDEVNDKFITETKDDVIDVVIVTKRVFTDEQLSQPPYNYTKVEIEDIYSDCANTDFNEDLTFSVEKYNARKQQESVVEYENKIVAEIRKKYNINQELAILRQRDTKPEEFAEYNEYVEQCKAYVRGAQWQSI